MATMSPQGTVAADTCEERGLGPSRGSGCADCSDLLHNLFGVLERIQAEFTRRIGAAEAPPRQA
ncbi:hypothetical protein [Streptomyces lunaelactis]|uniref:hypothetical protein n=1 Tax=Streptomyces lunaelactis TaxID=1535768 RepID=UPI001585A1D4|nr:hypothetical protein [Streptomyces lunaelactis]NUK28043.1 hypothetical protein [Streptomyces lunaelactis]NUK62130.1 hypothetical protein [Streptomyces lunaelactis]